MKAQTHKRVCKWCGAKVKVCDGSLVAKDTVGFLCQYCAGEYRILKSEGVKFTKKDKRR